MKRSLYTALSVVLLGAMALAQNAVPFVLQPLRPVSAFPGMSGLTLTVTGVGFASGATVNWNGSARATTVVSSTKLTATITAADLAHNGTALITVTNPAPGGGASNVVYFPVHPKTSPGGFARKDTTLTGGVTPYGMFVADFNGDGKLDVIVSYQTSPVLAVFLGNGDGTFQAPVTTAQSDASWPVAIGDFNGDGKLDVMTEGNFGTVWFYFGNGDGTFTEQPTFYGPSPATYSVGDINGDGKLDLIVSWGEQGVYGNDVWFGNGDGTFNDVQQLGVGAAGLSALSDYNRDGKLDVAIASFNDLEVAMGRSGGVFNTPTPYSLGGYQIFNLWAADLNNDGKPDLVSNDGFIFLNNGNGTFAVPATPNFPVTNSVQFLDANGDGKVDILGFAASTQGVNAVGIYPGNGDGTFQSPIVSQTSWGNNSPLGFGDFNGDGRMDVVTFSQDLVTGLPVMSVFLQNNLHISQSIINYGIVKLGSTSSQTSTLTNTGNSTLTLGTIGLGGNNPNYSTSTTCGTSLTTGASCDVTINFSPKEKGKALPAKVKINFSGTIGGPQFIELSGMGD
jgi:FG-GAP-like repeat